MAESTPLQFTVPDMDCQSCVASITEAVKRVDADASVAADLQTKHVIIGSTGDLPSFMKAIEDAGFTVQAV